MKSTMNLTKIKLTVSKGFSAVTPWRAGGVLALGTLLAAGTALYLDMAPGREVGSPPSIEKIEVAPEFTDLDAVDNYLSVDDLRRYVYPEEPGQPRADNPSPREGAGIHPDDEWMYGAPYLDDFSVDEAARLPSNPRAIERLEEQISIIVQNAAQAGKPLSNQEIERLDAQMDRLLADAALAANLARREDEARATMLRVEAYIAANKATEENAKSHRGGTWLPDTEYYLNPDYSEGQTGR